MPIAGPDRAPERGLETRAFLAICCLAIAGPQFRLPKRAYELVIADLRSRARRFEAQGNCKPNLSDSEIFLRQLLGILGGGCSSAGARIDSWRVPQNANRKNCLLQTATHR